MLSVWTVSANAWEAHDDSCVLPFLSASEHQQLALRRHPAKQREYLRSRYFMRYALAKLNWDDSRLGERHSFRFEDAGTGPRLLNSDAVDLSLSHTRSGWMAFAVSDHAVGVDIEQQTRTTGFAERLAMICQPEEQQIMMEHGQALNTAESFYSSWCAKEAEFKRAHGLTEKHERSKADLSITKVWHLDGYWLSVAHSTDESNPTINHIDGFSKGVGKAALSDWQPYPYYLSV